MKRYLSAVLAASVALGASGSALADPHHDDGNRHGPAMSGHRVHPDWRQGGHIARSDWNRGARVDWRSRHLRQPPRGYEWRQVDGNYVLAAATTGLIAGLILGGH